VGKIILGAIVLLAFCIGNAHESIDLSEAQEEALLTHQEIQLKIEEAGVLRNTILNPAYPANKKCDVIAYLEKLQIEIGYIADQFQSASDRIQKQSPFYDSGYPVREIYIAQVRDHLNSMKESIKISKINFCAGSI
jgi:hypothetical protein